MALTGAGLNKSWILIGYLEVLTKCESFVVHKPSDCKGLKRRNEPSDLKNEKRVKIKVEQAKAEEVPDPRESPDDDGYIS